MTLSNKCYLLQCFLKQIDIPLCVASSNDHCVVAVEQESLIASKDPNMIVETNFKDRKYQLLVCNSISTTVDCKFFVVRSFFEMARNHLFSAHS